MKTHCSNRKFVVLIGAVALCAVAVSTSYAIGWSGNYSVIYGKVDMGVSGSQVKGVLTGRLLSATTTSSNTNHRVTAKCTSGNVGPIYKKPNEVATASCPEYENGKMGNLTKAIGGLYINDN